MNKKQENGEQSSGQDKWQKIGGDERKKLNMRRGRIEGKNM